MISSEYPIITDEGYLPFLVCGAGQCTEQQPVERENGFGVHQLMYTVSGCGRIHYKGKEILLQEGHGIILEKDVPHEYRPADENGWNTVWVIFSGNGTDEILDKMELLSPEPIRIKSVSAMDDCYKKLFRALRAKDRMCVHNASPLLMQMVNELYKSYRNFSDPDQKSADSSDMLDTAVKFIEENYAEQLTLEQLSEMTGVGREYFCVMFKKNMGMRPFEYIAMRRVQEAKKLLSSTDMPVSDIGKTVGYSDKSYFGHVFRKYAGMSPSSFRGF